MHSRLSRTLLQWLIVFVIAIPIAQAEDVYKVTVGGTLTGMREQKAQDVQLGLEAAFNQVISADSMAVHIAIYDVNQDFYEAIRQQKLNAIFSSTLEYLGIASEIMPTPLLCASINGQCKSSIILLVRKDSPYNSLQDLRKKTISIPQWTLNDDGGLYLETLLLEEKQSPIFNFFSDVNTVSTSNRAITNVFFKTTEAALVREVEYDIATELNPQLKQHLKVIAVSEPYVMLTIAGLKNMDKKKLDLLAGRLLALNKTKKGKTVLNYLHMNGFAEIPQSELDNLRELIKKNKALKALKLDAKN